MVRGMLRSEGDTEREYREHRDAVARMLSARYGELDADARAELYQEAWASVLKRRGEGATIEDLRSYLMGAAGKLAAKRLTGADARRRQSFDPLNGPLIYLADAGPSIEESAFSAEDARRVRLLVDELGEPERALLKLRLELGLERMEIQERLGLSERQYRRIAERAAKAMVEGFRAADSGAWQRRKRSLLCACVFGVASERQRERARRLLADDPSCRAMMGELRGLGERAAALLPVPAAPVAVHRGRLGELLAAGKEHAFGAVTKATDPTPLAGARPGAVGAVIAGCIAAGGGAYCAIEGVPDALKPVLGAERQAEEKRPSGPARPPVAALPAPPAADPVQHRRPEAAAPQPAAPAERPKPVPQPEQEFQPQADPAPVPAPEPAVRSSGGGGGEFGP